MQDRRTFLKNIGSGGLFAAACGVVWGSAEYGEHTDQACRRPTHSVTVASEPYDADLQEYRVEAPVENTTLAENASAFNASAIDAADCPYRVPDDD